MEDTAERADDSSLYKVIINQAKSYHLWEIMCSSKPKEWIYASPFEKNPFLCGGLGEVGAYKFLYWSPSSSLSRTQIASWDVRFVVSPASLVDDILRIDVIELAKADPELDRGPIDLIDARLFL